MSPSHHPLDNDDFGPQSSTDGEDGHEAEAEDHKVDAEDNFTRIKQPGCQSETQDCPYVKWHSREHYGGLLWQKREHTLMASQ